jgi:hypothetical protein
MVGDTKKDLDSAQSNLLSRGTVLRQLWTQCRLRCLGVKPSMKQFTTLSSMTQRVCSGPNLWAPWTKVGIRDYYHPPKCQDGTCFELLVHLPCSEQLDATSSLAKECPLLSVCLVNHVEASVIYMYVKSGGDVIFCSRKYVVIFLGMGATMVKWAKKYNIMTM